MTETLRPEDMPSAPPPPAGGTYADANFQTVANAHDWLPALRELCDKVRSVNHSYPWRTPRVFLEGEYGWRPDAQGKGLSWVAIDGMELIGRRGQAMPSTPRNGSALRVLTGHAPCRVFHDFTGSRNILIRGVDLNCDDATIPVTDPGATDPKYACGVLLAASSQGHECNQITLERCTVSGPFTAGAICTHGAEEVTVDRSWIFTNGAPVGTSPIYAGTTNGFQINSAFLTVYQGQIVQDTVLTIRGGIIENASPHDSWALTLDGAAIVNLEHTALVSRSSGIRLTGPNPTKHLKITAGTKINGGGGPLQYMVEQSTTATAEVVTLDGFITDAVAAIYRANVAGLAVKALRIADFTAPASALALATSGTVQHSHLYCQGHGVSVGSAIDGTNRLYAPGAVSAPGGVAPGVIQA